MLKIFDLPQEQLQSSPYFDAHVLVKTFSDPETELQGVIAVHRGSTTRPAFGATRFAYYSTESELIDEALKLAKLMSYKAALANLPYGGAKAVLQLPTGPFDRELLLKTYAKVVNSLDGVFITGADLGISPADVEIMKSVSPHMVGIYNDPVLFTAFGIFRSIEQTVLEVWNEGEITNRSFAIQGLGKIGEGVLQQIYPFTNKIVVTDINPQRVSDILLKYPGITAVAADEIFSQKVDIFCPCAHGGVLNEHTINDLACKVILGGANNQLSSEEIGDALWEKGITYVPDYVVNAGGLISVVDEFKHQNGNDERVRAHVLEIPNTVHKLFAFSKQKNLAIHRVANTVAEQIFSKYE